MPLPDTYDATAADPPVSRASEGGGWSAVHDTFPSKLTVTLIWLPTPCTRSGVVEFTSVADVGNMRTSWTALLPCDATAAYVRPPSSNVSIPCGVKSDVNGLPASVVASLAEPAGRSAPSPLPAPTRTSWIPLSSSAAAAANVAFPTEKTAMPRTSSSSSKPRDPSRADPASSRESPPSATLISCRPSSVPNAPTRACLSLPRSNEATGEGASSTGKSPPSPLSTAVAR